MHYTESVMTSANRITVNLSAEEYTALSKLSKKYQVSLAWLGRRAIAELIEQNKKNPGQFDMPFTAEAKRKS